MSLPPPEALVAHESPGRLRLKVPERRGDAAFFAEVGGRLAEAPGVREVETNARTASLLIRHASSRQALLDWAGAQGLLTPAARPFAPRRRRPERAPEWRHLLAGCVALLALVQAFRGQLLGPAATLAFMAAQIARLDRSQGEGDGAADSGEP